MWGKNTAFAPIHSTAVGGYRSPSSELVSTAILAKTACIFPSGHGPPSFGPIELRASNCSPLATSSKPPVLVNSNWPRYDRLQDPGKIQTHCQAPARQQPHPANVPKLTQLVSTVPVSCKKIRALWGHYGPLWDGRPRPADRRVRHKPSPKRACCRAPIGGRPLRIIHQAYAIIKSQRAWRGVRRESRAVSWPPEVSVGNLYGIPKFEQGEGGSRSLVAGTGYGVRRSPTRSLKSIYPTTRQARRRAYAARMERHLLGLSENWDWFYVWVAVAFSILHRPQSACLVPSCS